MLSWKNSEKKHLNIGVLINNLHDEYSRLLWNGINDRARELDFNVIFFQCESLKVPYAYNYQYNVICSLIHKNYIDALIIATGAVCNFLNKEEVYSFIKQFEPIPIVSISISIKGIPSVLSDNKNGVREAIKHLAEKHSRKKIAFIKGSEVNSEAQLRYEAYCETLEMLGIPFEKELVVSGDFTEVSGIRAIKELLDNRKITFDSIMCSNDNMAIGVMNELSNRGISIPENVSIIGFDNIIDCEYVKPPLTSVKQSIYLQGKIALETAFNILNGKKVDNEIFLPTSLAIRSSCGCLNTSEQVVQIKKYSKTEILSQAEEIIENTDYIGANSFLLIKEIEEFIDILSLSNSKSFNKESFLKNFYSTILSQKSDGINISFWKSIVPILKQYLLFLPDINRKKIHSLFQDISEILEKVYQGLLISRSSARERWEISAHFTVQQIFSSRSIEELLNNIIHLLPEIQIYCCYIFFYEKPISYEPSEEWVLPKNIRLFLALDQRVGIQFAFPEGYSLSPSQFIPKEFYNSEKRHTFLVTPIFFLKEQYGYIIYEINIKEDYVYRTITDEIVNTYRGLLLMEQLKEEQKKVFKRNQELEADILIAKKIQNQLIPSKSPRPYIAFMYKTMDKVGGDFFDFVEFEQKNWIGIFLSDVSGHGIPAAFVTSMIKTTIQQMRPYHDNPSFLLFALNEALFQQTGDNFITAFYGIYKPEKSEFIFANAGHNPPYIIAEDRVYPIPDKGGGIPLAILSNKELLEKKREYVNQTVKLKEGSKLILYTDGLTEATRKDNPSQSFETNLLKTTFLQLQNIPAELFVSEIYLRLVEFHGDDQFSDDVCMICLDVSR